MIDSPTMINMIISPYNLEMAIYIYIGLATFSALVIFWINKQIAKFATLNTSLPFLDVATDIKAFLVYLLYEDHPYWAYLTFFSASPNIQSCRIVKPCEETVHFPFHSTAFPT